MIEDHGLFVQMYVCVHTYMHTHRIYVFRNENTAMQSKYLDCHGPNDIIDNLTVLHLLFEYIVEGKY